MDHTTCLSPAWRVSANYQVTLALTQVGSVIRIGKRQILHYPISFALMSLAYGPRHILLGKLHSLPMEFNEGVRYNGCLIYL